MRWTNIKFSVLKKYPSPYSDGTNYNWRSWRILMHYVGMIRPNFIIWNPYTEDWDVVESVKFRRSNIRRDGRRVIGSAVCKFEIRLVSGYVLYDVEQWVYNFSKKYGDKESFLSNLEKFNAQFDMDPLWPGPWLQQEKPLAADEWYSFRDDVNWYSKFYGLI